VYVEATHNWLTRFFRTASLVKDRAVLRFEPMRVGQCN